MMVNVRGLILDDPKMTLEILFIYVPWNSPQGLVQSRGYLCKALEGHGIESK
jgi:hypothetical protein